MKVKSQREIILVFKTSVKYKKDIVKIRKAFEVFNDLILSFDLEDCDRIMRTESTAYFGSEIISIMQILGHYCEELE
ncbi:MAG: hypothetical protein ABI576_13905 [Flavobacterium sp.]